MVQQGMLAGRRAPGCRRCASLLGVRHARLGERHRLVLLVDGVVARGFQTVAVLRFDLALVDLALLQFGMTRSTS